MEVISQALIYCITCVNLPILEEGEVLLEQSYVFGDPQNLVEARHSLLAGWNDMSIVVEAEVDISALLIRQDSDSGSTVDLLFDLVIHWGPEEEMCAAWLDKDWKDEGVGWVCNFLPIDEESLTVAQILTRIYIKELI